MPIDTVIFHFGGRGARKVTAAVAVHLGTTADDLSVPVKIEAVETPDQARRVGKTTFDARLNAADYTLPNGISYSIEAPG